MRKFIHLLLGITLLTGCNWPRIKQTPTATSTGLAYTQCAWVWATQALPDLSAKVQADMQAASLRNVTARAEAYGENCIDQAGKVDSFATLETDFRITAIVGDLSDRESLGNLLEDILKVLDAIPTDQIPGPQAGYINVSFQAGGEELNIMFTFTHGKSARESGKHGGALLEELQNK